MKTLRYFLSSGAWLTLAALSTLATPGNAQYSSPVKVVNSGPAQAVPVVNAAEPYTAICKGFTTCSFVLPVGKRLVIESITGYGYLAGTDVLLASIQTSFASGLQNGSLSSGWFQYIPTVPQTNLISGITIVGISLRTYLLADSPGLLEIHLAGGGANSNCQLTISGYLM